MSIAQLGNSLRCKNDQEFGKITRLEVKDQTVILNLECPKCRENFSNSYSVDDFISMANMSLIDDPDIVDFQKKMIISTGKFFQMDNGMVGSYYVADDNVPFIKEAGPALLCKCNKFHSLTIKKFKKDWIEFSTYCEKCNPKGKKKKIFVLSVMALGKAGLIDESIVALVRDEYQQLSADSFDSSETYTGNDGTLAYHVQEALGMQGERTTFKCYICGISVPKGANKCPKCGSDLD
jgi:hypothetical protein